MYRQSFPNAKRIASLIVVAAVIVGGWVLTQHVLAPMPLSQLLAQAPELSGQVVGIQANQAHEAGNLLGYRAWQVSDDGSVWALVLTAGPAPSGRKLSVLVHDPVLFGSSQVVLEELSHPATNLWRNLWVRLGFGRPQPAEVARPAAAPEQFAGNVTAEISLLNNSLFTMQTADNRFVTIASNAGGAPAGAAVQVTAERVPGLDLQNGHALYAAQETIVGLSSVNTLVQAFDGRRITIEGKVGGGLSLLGNAAYTIHDKDGAQLVVLSNGQCPAEGTDVKVTGQFKYLAGVGPVSWSVLCAAEAKAVAPAVPGQTLAPTAPAQPAPGTSCPQPGAPAAPAVPSSVQPTAVVPAPGGGGQSFPGGNLGPTDK